MEKVLMFLGVVFLVFVVLIISGTIMKKAKIKTAKLGKLYFKDWPDGNRTFHLELDTDLSDVKNGDRYMLEVQQEVLTDLEKKVTKEILED